MQELGHVGVGFPNHSTNIYLERPDKPETEAEAKAKAWEFVNAHKHLPYCKVVFYLNHTETHPFGGYSFGTRYETMFVQDIPSDGTCKCWICTRSVFVPCHYCESVKKRVSN